MTFVKGNVPHNKREIDESVLRDLYLNQGLSGEAIAKKLNIAACAIYSRLKKLGIVRNSSEAQIGRMAKENNPNWKGGKWVGKDGYIVTNHSGK